MLVWSTVADAGRPAGAVGCTGPAGYLCGLAGSSMVLYRLAASAQRC